ncbi:helix-turn-helix domain-containing protein [Parabacteroides johnsonii]|nr:helix-turn-helix domain-containing protein [Parabacteroides johnsonii]
MESVRKANLNSTDIQHSTIYNNGELAFLDKVSDINVTESIQMEIYVIVLCLQGKASVCINGNPYVAYANDIFICTPNNLLEDCLLSIDFKCHCICMSPEYVQRILPMADNTWDIKILFEKNPLCSLQPQEVVTFCQYYDILCSKVHLPSGAQKKVIDALILAFIYDMQIIIDRMIQVIPRPFNSGEYLFKNFIDLLGASYPKNRNVSYYADRLHVTSKYLSSVCKKISGQTASKVIDHYVLKDIEYLMKHTSKTIKIISVELDFPDISFFGKYVKKHFGMAPKMLREKYREEQ